MVYLVKILYPIKMDIRKEFGKQLQKLRLSYNLSQEELSERLGKATSTIQKIESGVRFPSPTLIEEISQFFNIKCSVLFDFETIFTPDENNMLISEFKSLDKKGKKFFYDAMKLYNISHKD